MQRLPNWQSALDAFVRSHAREPFQYGSWDCCLFVCDAIQVMTGVDVAEPFRGKYSSRKEASAAVKKFAGSASVRAAVEKVTEVNGMKAIEPAFLQRGDVALVKRARDYSLALVSLTGMELLAVTDEGFARLPLSAAVKAWRV